MTNQNGTLPPLADRTYTAWELAGDWWWVDAGLWAVTEHGRTRYETVTACNGDRVRLWRLDTRNGLNEVHRYVEPELPMRLVTD
jgi:hypothetical protein